MPLGKTPVPCFIKLPIHMNHLLGWHHRVNVIFDSGGHFFFFYLGTKELHFPSPFVWDKEKKTLTKRCFSSSVIPQLGITKVYLSIYNSIYHTTSPSINRKHGGVESRQASGVERWQYYKNIKNRTSKTFAGIYLLFNACFCFLFFYSSELLIDQ